MLKQIETANICLNMERDCISVMLDTLAKVGLPLENNPGAAPTFSLNTTHAIIEVHEGVYALAHSVFPVRKQCEN